MEDTRIPLTNRLSSRIKKAREKSGLSQSALGRLAKVPRARIKRIECRELKTISRKEYTSLCNKLKISVLLPTFPSSTARKQAAKVSHPTRRTMLRLLDEAGVLDMTLRELIT